MQTMTKATFKQAIKDGHFEAQTDITRNGCCWVRTCGDKKAAKMRIIEISDWRQGNAD